MAIDDTQTSPSASGIKDKPGNDVPETSLLTYPQLRGISIEALAYQARRNSIDAIPRLEALLQA